MDRLIRQYLLQDQQPAIVLIASMNTSNTEILPHRSAENLHMVLAQYYGLPVISLRALGFQYGQEPEQGFLDASADHMSDLDLTGPRQNGHHAQASEHGYA
jgi:hypothetical protein